MAQEFYNDSFYTKTDIASFVGLTLLTGDDFKEITGDDYVAQTN
ncbi:XkdX family protein [Lactobacillus bombicola]|uniref:XkdX family protein n=2 Tax=Lactobacillus bombicola TaxID=1505723 RepID=A0A396SVY6_9LACO|nr:XkdX family protein [Lactobacillus bombicola]